MAKFGWFTKDEIQNRLDGGRGVGRGLSYQPWIKITELSSDGTSYRVLSHRTGRVVHLLSKLEFLAFSLLDWDLSVHDIREQYPVDLNTGLEVAKRSGIKYPKQGDKYHLLTTDLLIDYDSIQNKQKAIQVKYSSDLLDKRVVEKLELERRCFEAKNISWQLITELDIPHVAQKNVDWILGGLDLHIESDFNQQVQSAWSSISSYSDTLVSKACSSHDEVNSLPVGTTLKLIRNAFGYRLLAFDITKPYHRLKCNDIKSVSSQAHTGQLYAVS